MQARHFVIIAAAFGFSGVAAGAFAAHALQGSADPQAAEVMRTGSSYALWHALAMLGYLALGGRSQVPLALFAGGTLLFSASLYALALGAPRIVGVVTPLGGLALLAGWIALAVVTARGGLSALNPP